MKKNIILAGIVSLFMIAGFAVFLYIMGKNGDEIKQKQLALDNSEIGIVSLQGEKYYKKFNTQTEYNDLYITGDNRNVLVFDTSDPANIYNVSVSDAVHNQLVRMQDKKDYDFDNPLIAYNPYGTNSGSLYFYFETKSECYLRYTVTVENESVPDFVRTMNDSDGRGYCRHEYLLTGLLPGETNYLNLELVSEDGDYVDSCVYRITMPEPVYGNAVSINADMSRNVDKMTNGLFFCYGTGKKSIPVYDNSGYLRAEIPLLEECAVPVCINNADMLVAYTPESIARISRSGQVLATYPLGDYTIGKQMLYNTRGQILAIASDSGRNTVDDLILSIDMESGKVKVAADMKKILKNVYKKYSDGKKKSGIDWIQIESMEYINNNDLLINSENMSSVIKLDNIMSENPTVGYIIGNKEIWDIKGFRNKLLKKRSLEDMAVESGNEDSEESEDTEEPSGNDTEINNILEADSEEHDPFKDMNGNVSLMYEPVANSDGDEEGSAGRYYIAFMNNNRGKDTSYQRYLVNEEDKSYSLVSEMKLSNNKNGGSIQGIADNYVVCQGAGKSFAEYGKDGSVLIDYSLSADTVIKNSMKNFWFR